MPRSCGASGTSFMCIAAAGVPSFAQTKRCSAALWQTPPLQTSPGRNAAARSAAAPWVCLGSNPRRAVFLPQAQSLRYGAAAVVAWSRPHLASALPAGVHADLAHLLAASPVLPCRGSHLARCNLRLECTARRPAPSEPLRPWLPAVRPQSCAPSRLLEGHIPPHPVSSDQRVTRCVCSAMRIPLSAAPAQLQPCARVRRWGLRIPCSRELESYACLARVRILRRCVARFFRSELKCVRIRTRISIKGPT